ncbi:ABC transporter of metals domain protein [Chlamydia psittaci GR9]|nr:ABC transporter of metals domain protein [Chlamydia psittaci GR9]AFS24329.1 ABC transporter of metals domain protein [Chlamydia psittaci WS/RT/E30]EPP30002.1 ABC transporter of metals domain protein [Chlamydia psittaci 08-2626_L3]
MVLPAAYPSSNYYRHVDLHYGRNFNAKHASSAYIDSLQVFL